MRLIDVNTLVGKDGLFSKRGCPGNCQHCGLWSAEGCRIILEAPTVDAVEVVYAQWVLADDDRLICSHCKNVKVAYEQLCYLKSTGRWNYCPNCGARMMDGDWNG